MEHSLPIQVVNMEDVETVARAVLGEPIGTLITAEVGQERH